MDLGGIMFGKIAKYWRGLSAAAILTFPNVWEGIKWAWDWLGRLDLFSNHLPDFHGIDPVIGFLTNPPPWTIFPSIFFAVAVVLWDVRRQAGAPPTEVAVTVDPHRTLRLGFYSACVAIAVSTWIVAWPTMFPAQTTLQPHPVLDLTPKPPAPPPAQPPPWVMPYEIEQQQKIGRTLLIYSSTELTSMYALGQNLNAYLNRWVKIDDPILTLPVSETIEKKEYYVVRMGLDSGTIFGSDQIAAYFEPKKWGDRLLNVRTHDHLRAICQFVGFDRVLVNESYKVYTHVLIGRNCELL
jgi:hypothetical protein